jgi:hypothetical protein
MEDILSKHTRRGLRNLQSGKKDVFPDNWSPREIETAIMDAYRYSKRIHAQGERVLVQGVGKGRLIEIWVNKSTKVIETAYPVK